MNKTPFILQGHRGARGLRPENTLSSFETALDAGANSIETDVHLTADGVPVLIHEPVISERLCRLRPGATAPPPESRPAVRDLSLAELRSYRADRNPDPRRFAVQRAQETPLARLFADARSIDPYTIPTLEDFFAFVLAYAGDLGRQAGKTSSRQASLHAFTFDLELKRVPYHPQTIGDDFGGEEAGLMERRVVEVVGGHPDLAQRTIIRSFDHRVLPAVRQLQPALRTAVLITGTAPVSPGAVTKQAGASLYCPDYHFIDTDLIRRAHADGIQVLPWTVNDPADWQHLVDWGVDGITTDYPDRLSEWLRERGIPF